MMEEQAQTVQVDANELMRKYSEELRSMSHRAFMAELGIEVLQRQLTVLQQQLEEPHDQAVPKPST